MTTVFEVRVVEEQHPHYTPAYVEIAYRDGVQSTTFRLSPGAVFVLMGQLRDAAHKAEDLHLAACQAAESWYLGKVRIEEGKE
jgi:hypothetical protein